MRTHPTRIAIAAAITHALMAPAVIAALRVEPDAAATQAADAQTAAATTPAVPAPQADPARDAMIARVNALLEQTWTEGKVEPAPIASDGEFLRRASLDFTGVIPRTSEVREYLADGRPDKQARLIERLIASPRYATHMATTWRNRILPLGEDPTRTREALGLQKWLRTRFAENLRYDRIVGGLLLASGENELGPALYFQANGLAPDKLAGSASELFMGVDLHCAQCHDHPFADWKQKDFWGFAAFFARTKSGDNGPMNPRDMSYRLVDVDKGEVTLPELDEVVPPHFPQGDAVADEPWQTRRSQLVVWLTSRDNPFFARSTVNAAWQHLFGHALVASIRPADGEKTTPQRQILDELATHFTETNFDMRELWRTLANTRAYQLSSQHPHPESAAPQVFARILPKPLTPEQLYDSLLLLAPQSKMASYPADGDDDNNQPPPPTGLEEDPTRIEFVRRMRTPPGDPTQFRAGTLQALMLMNGQFMSAVSAHDKSSLLGALEAPFLDDSQRIDALFLATLARTPGDDERKACLEQLTTATGATERSETLADVLWALVNTTEFAFNH